jgi:hypothetical protein
MLTIFLSLITQLNDTVPLPAAQVEVAEVEVEAVFVPADWTGPVVAAPFDETVF